MRYRAWTHAGTALLLAATPTLSAFAQNAGSTRAASPAANVPATVSVPIVPVLDTAAQSALQRAISNSQRIEPSRDRWRNPAATLQFFGVRPTDTVIEVWPGQGWYTSVLGPYLKQGGGSLIVGHFDAASTNSSVVRQIVDAYRARFASNEGTYGSVSVVPFGPRSGALGAPGSADSVLTFRNIHNWMAQGWAEKAFGDFFLVLKPGGILGIEEHRGRTDEPQDPLARDGYVREDFVIQLAREAGFDFIGRSEINANPADTKDHPFGVWTLPPVSRTSALGQRDDPGFDRIRYNAIGESDRMTLRFRKPLSATGAPPAAGTRWAPVIVAPAQPTPTPRPTPPVVRVVRPPVVVAPVVVTPAAVPPAGGPAIVTARPSPAAPAPSQVTPPITPSIGLPPPRNSEAAAPRAVEPVPKPKPTIVAPAPVAPAPVAPAPVAPAPVVPAPVLPAPVVPAPPTVPPPAVDPTIIAKPLEPIVVPVAPPPPPIIAPDPSPPVSPILNKPDPVIPNPVIPDPVVPDIVDPPVKVTVTPEPIAAPASPPVLTPPQRPTPVQPPLPKPVTALPSAPIVRAPPPPATRPAIAQPVRPTVARPPPPPPTTPAPAPKPAPAAARPAPRPKAAPPVVAPAPRLAAPRPAAARPAVARPAAAPPPKAKAKAPPPPARPVIRPAPPPPVAKKKATPPPVDPNKPDWVVPRRRS